MEVLILEISTNLGTTTIEICCGDVVVLTSDFIKPKRRMEVKEGKEEWKAASRRGMTDT